MAQQTVNVGATANSGTGDPLRTAFGKINSNFTELYSGVSPTDGPYDQTQFWSDVTSSFPSPPRIWRCGTKFLGGDAVKMGATLLETSQTWLPNGAAGATYGLAAEFVWMANTGGTAISGLTKSSLMAANDLRVPIAVAGFVIQDRAGSTGWCFYGDMQFEASAGAVASWGLELALKNKGANYTSGAYGAVAGVHGIWLPAGGDDSYGGTHTNPNNTAIMIGANASTWNKGIIFLNGSLTPISGVANTGVAIEMAQGHRIQWLAPDGNLAARIESDSTTGDPAHVISFNGQSIVFSGASNTTLKLTQVTSQVNNVRISAAVTGSPPKIEVDSASGDTNVDLFLGTKGTGVLKFGSVTALGAETLTGYITIRDAGGTLRKLAVVS